MPADLEQLKELLHPATYPDRTLLAALKQAQQTVPTKNGSNNGHALHRAAEIVLLGIGGSSGAIAGGSSVKSTKDWLQAAKKGKKRKHEDNREDEKLKNDFKGESTIRRGDGPNFEHFGPGMSGKRRKKGKEGIPNQPIVLSSDDGSDIEILPQPPPIVRSDKVSTEDVKPTSIPAAKRLLTLDLLRPISTPDTKRNPARPPIRLTTPQQIAATVPCSLVPSPLSKEFAGRLYLTLLKAIGEEVEEEIEIEGEEGHAEDGKDKTTATGPKPVSGVAQPSNSYLGDHSSLPEPLRNPKTTIGKAGFRKHKWYINGKLVQSNFKTGYYRLRKGESSGEIDPGGRDGGGEETEGEDGPIEEGGVKAGGEYWYAGKKEPEPPTFPPILKEAIKLINPFVNSILGSSTNPPQPGREADAVDIDADDAWRDHIWHGGRQGPKRYKYEYDGEWKANVCAVNCYEGGESSIGWHSDQLTHIGPYPTIVSLSLGTPRAFRLRPIPHRDDPTLDILGRPLRTYEIMLPHNSILIMHASCQELYKHSVAPVGKNQAIDFFRPAYDINGEYVELQNREKRNERVNITFRFYRPDFHPEDDKEEGRQGIPNCKCGIPAKLQADQKGKVAASLSRKGTKAEAEAKPTTDPAEDILFVYRCQAMALSGELTGCGFFRLLDCEKEGRGPLIGNRAKGERS